MIARRQWSCGATAFAVALVAASARGEPSTRPSADSAAAIEVVRAYWASNAAGEARRAIDETWDVEAFCREAFGANWPALTADRQARLKRAVAGLLVAPMESAKSGAAIRAAGFRIDGARDVVEGASCIVSATLDVAAIGRQYRHDFLVARAADGRWKIVDSMSDAAGSTRMMVAYQWFAATQRGGDGLAAFEQFVEVVQRRLGSPTTRP